MEQLEFAVDESDFQPSDGDQDIQAAAYLRGTSDERRVERQKKGAVPEIIGIWNKDTRRQRGAPDAARGRYDPPGIASRVEAWHRRSHNDPCIRVVRQQLVRSHRQDCTVSRCYESSRRQTPPS